ncbi:MAG: hypothetical protein HY042_04320 [Spirochaetia bacterium]|nr:hypothetical protein [Spirochaetia bacterium]
MSQNLQQMLGQFNENDYTVKLCRGIFSVIPFAPPFVFYNTLEGAVQRIKPDAGPEILAKAQEIAASEEVAKALWVLGALDMADKGLGIYTGIKNIFGLVSDAPRQRVFEADPQQAADAALKAVGLAYVTHKLYPGELTQKVNRFKGTPAGQEIALYFATAEVALPFTDNVLEGGGKIIGKLMHGRSESVQKFASFAGQPAVTEATGMLEHMTEPLDGIIDRAKGYVGPIAEKIKAFIPGAVGAVDSITGVLATGVDVMPCWQFLGARLAAEACALRAVHGGV